MKSKSMFMFKMALEKDNKNTQFTLMDPLLGIQYAHNNWMDGLKRSWKDCDETRQTDTQNKEKENSWWRKGRKGLKLKKNFQIPLSTWRKVRIKNLKEKRVEFFSTYPSGVRA